jgi:hypothetical protein
MLNTIRPYITKDEPFGPIDSGDIDSSDLKALLMLFEKHNLIYKNLHSRPSIIIGRRGSGKRIICAVFLTSNMITMWRSARRVYWGKWQRRSKS